MSKRICLSLLHAPQRTQPPLIPCALNFTARDNLQHRRNHPQHVSRRHKGASTSAGGAARKGGKMGPSMSLQMKRQQAAMMKDGSVLDHLGVLDQTFIPPTGKNLPPLFSRERLTVLWYTIKNYLYLGQSKFIAFWMVKPKHKLERSKAAGIAKEIYEEMYTHFASGNLEPIESRLSPGLLSSLRSRIGQRAPNTTLKWNLDRYISNPKLVSYRFTVTDPKDPNDNKSGIDQAIVRIHSQQSLQKLQRTLVRDPQTGQKIVREIVIDSQGKEVLEEELERERRRNVKETVEYVVIQRLMKKSKPGPWHMWGTTEETTMAKMKKAYNKQEKQLLGSLKT